MKTKTFKMTLLILAGSMAINGSVFAANPSDEIEEASVSAGVTPNSPFLYPLDLWMEKIKLKFADNQEERADLLIQFSKERYAELLKVAELENQEIINKATASYTSSLQKVRETIGDIVTAEETELVTKEILSTRLNEVVAPNLELEETLPEDIQMTLNENRELNSLVADGLSLIDTEKVTLLRAAGLGYDEVVTVVVVAEAAGVLEEEIQTKLQEGKSYRQILHELNVDKEEIAREIAVRSIDSQIESIKAKIELVKKIGDETQLYDLAELENKLAREKEQLIAKIQSEDVKEVTKKAKEQIQQIAEDSLSKTKEQAKELTDEVKTQTKEQAQEVINNQLQSAKEKASEITNDSSDLKGKVQDTIKQFNPLD